MTMIMINIANDIIITIIPLNVSRPQLGLSTEPCVLLAMMTMTLSIETNPYHFLFKLNKLVVYIVCLVNGIYIQLCMTCNLTCTY